jgi:transcriptional regulator with XRE-family HTH domain
MENKAREFGLFIDGLRLERNISREDLCYGIMSLSQYKRYLRGDTSIPNGKLVQLADKLKFSITDIYSLFGKKHNENYKKIWEIFLLIKENNYIKALELADDMKHDVIVSQYNKLFYDYVMIKIQHSLKMVSDIHVLNLYSNLIDYPVCTNNDSFNMVEISALIGIVDVSAMVGNYDAMNLLYRILTSKTFSYSSSGDSSFLPSIYSILSRAFGAQEDHEKVLEISQMGIDYCLKHETSNAISHLFLYKSLALLNLNMIDEGKDAAKKCLMHLIIENKPQKFDSFKKVIEDEYKIEIKDLIKF